MKLKTIPRTLRITVIAAILATATISFASAAKGWEPVKVERQDAEPVISASEFEIKTAKGVIIVTANHPVQIKIFTILGRLVSTGTAPQGTSQFTLPAHGVYIVKIGDVTCKVAI